MSDVETDRAQLSDAEAAVLEHVRASGLVERERRYVALVSGGRDSLCLLDVLRRLCGAGALTALHVNYGLRGADSDADERHVRMLCERAGVACVVHRADQPPVRGNLQAWARAVRYGAAATLAGERDALVATGHTASDQVETVLYRLAAAPGRRALLGMAPSDGRLVRPLLGATREQTAAYCRARGIAWRDDRSNDDERFVRVRVRAGLLGELRRVHPAAERNVLRSAELLRAEAAVLDELVAGVLHARSEIELAQLVALEPALARLVVIRLAEQAAGELVPAVGARLDELTALGAGGGSARIDVGCGVSAIVEYGVLRFLRPGAEPPVEAIDVALPVPGSASFGGWTLRSELHALAGERALARREDDGSVALLDADRLDLAAIHVRSWRPGDRIRSIGLDGSKTLADLFTDRRVPRRERVLTPVVACASEVVWVPGLATAARVRLRPATRRVALLTARRG